MSCENATSGGFLTFPAKKSTFMQHWTSSGRRAAVGASERSARNCAELIYIKVAGRHARADRQTDGRTRRESIAPNVGNNRRSRVYDQDSLVGCLSALR